MDILIIDDDSVDRIAATRTIQNTGLTSGLIEQAETGTDGIQKALSKNYDVILLDYQIPPSNGIEVLREIRGSGHSSTAIVMLSHSNDERLALSCIEAGAQDFIMKSEVTAPRLKRAILIATERHMLQKQVDESHRKLKFLAERDALTGLRNRYVFDATLENELQRCSYDQRRVGLLFIDIDNFKRINDAFGHQVGDKCLVDVARRLETTLRDSDILCRLGGDEFAVLVTDLPQAEKIRHLSDRILEAMDSSLEVDGNVIDVTLSIGVATYPECDETVTGLMKCADVAMYRSKELGRNQVQYYSRDFHQRMQARIKREEELKKAIEKQELRLYYQPQIDSKTHRMTGVEALLRWEHSTDGLVPPNDFIPLAEESDLIIDIGRWVIHEACEQVSVWSKLPFLEEITFTIAVNVSARQLKDHGLADYLESCLKFYKVPSSLIELELTESGLEDSLEAIDMLQGLAQIGVKLAIDDFGTGYSSLSQLKRFPFTVLKIDKCFVQGASDQETSFLSAISAFAHSLGYETVAEGVETEAQRKTCELLRINRLQGFLFSKPLPPSEFEKNWFKGLSH